MHLKARAGQSGARLSGTLWSGKIFDRIFYGNDYRGSLGIFPSQIISFGIVALRCAIFCDSKMMEKERVNAETKIEG